MVGGFWHAGVPFEYMAEGLPAAISQDVCDILAAVSELLSKRARKGRRQARGEITVPNVSSSFKAVFEHWVVEGLWRPVLRTNSSDLEWWSCKPEACDRICNFHDMYALVVRDGRTRRAYKGGEEDEGLVTYRMAGGSAMVGTRGDICSICPPLLGRLQKHAVGTSGKLFRHSLRLWFSVGVIPAVIGARDSDGEEEATIVQEECIRLFLHDKFPDVCNVNSWPQVPGYEDPAAYYVRHVQEIVCKYGLDPQSLAVMELKAMDFKQPELAPAAFFFLRRGDAETRSVKGQMFDEDKGQYVPARTKALKERLWKKNLNVYRKRRADSEKALADYNKRLRREPARDEEFVDSDDDFDYIEPDESDLEWAEQELMFLQSN